ncbi:unnamed protein product [Caenorhabditis angaria]|uniref:Protein NDNF n=1 Tax=Caenorhabditis angaria TaxID=860376 RepID=A0A9P1ITC2_9PELO|nr:unnamed protein product [Caenorhabditis angaria]
MKLLLLIVFLSYVNSSVIIPKDREVVFELDNFEKRFYLDAEEEKPLHIIITPCGAPVYYQIFKIAEDLSFDEELNIISDHSIGLHQSEHLQLLVEKETTTRTQYFIENVPGKLVLVLATPLAASVRIFITSEFEKRIEQYPELPNDSRLAMTLDSDEEYRDDVKLRVTWKIAEKIKYSEEFGRYRFCAIISQQPIEYAAQCNHFEENLETIRCVSKFNNSITIDNLRREKSYYVHLFLRDYRMQTSSEYEKSVVRIPAKTIVRKHRHLQKKSVARNLFPGKLQSTQLENKKGSYKNYRFTVPEGNGTQTAMLIVHSCNGLVRINIYRNGQILKKSERFSGFRRFVVTNLRGGTMKIQIVNDDDSLKTVRVWASTDLSTSPYPNLPDDTSIKLVGRTCQSVSIQWLRALDDNVKYCVYKRKESSQFIEHLVSTVDNLCDSTFESSHIVGCYKSHTSPKSLIETTINDLDPFSTYRFDLLATPINRPMAQPLPYRTIWVRTNLSCHL